MLLKHLYQSNTEAGILHHLNSAKGCYVMALLLIIERPTDLGAAVNIPMYVQSLRKHQRRLYFSLRVTRGCAVCRAFSNPKHTIEEAIVGQKRHHVLQILSVEIHKKMGRIRSKKEQIISYGTLLKFIAAMTLSLSKQPLAL